MGNLKKHVKSWRWLAGLLLVASAGIALAGSAVYTYDTLGRLSKVTYGNGVVVTYAYDAAGNRTAQVIAGAP
jgi:YD repeat-containing protein